MKRLLAALGILVAGAIIVFGLGWSTSESEPVAHAVFERLPASVELLLAAFIGAIAIGGIAGYARARVRLPVVRGALEAAMLAARAIPIFIAAIAVQFAFMFARLPTAGMASSDAFDLRDRLAHLIAPALVLAVPFGGWASLIFYDGARASGERMRVSARGVVTVVATTAALIGPALAAATVIVETVFAWPGVSRRFAGAMQQFDFHLAAGLLVLYLAAIVALETSTGSARTEEPVPGGRPGRLSPVGIAACAALVAAIAAAVAAPLIAPVGPYFIDVPHWVGYPLAPGVAGHPLGTDENGRDLLARLLFGLRTSLAIAAGAAVVASALAALAAKAFGAVRWIGTERALRLTAIRPFAALPLILVAVTAGVAKTRATDFLTPLVIALMIGAVSWPAGIAAFRARGARMLSGVVGLAAGAFLLETTISSMGFGVQPPVPSLGNMLVNVQSNLFVAPAVAIAPSIASVVVLAVLYTLADALREVPAQR